METLSGNLNKAVASGLAGIMRLNRLEVAFKQTASDLPKSDKEALLVQIRELRRELGLPDLPDYNSPEFCEWFGKPCVNN